MLCKVFKKVHSTFIFDYQKIQLRESAFVRCAALQLVRKCFDSKFSVKAMITDASKVGGGGGRMANPHVHTSAYTIGLGKKRTECLIHIRYGKRI